MTPTYSKWPPVDKYLIEILKAWIGDETPVYQEGMSPEQCLVAMAEKKGMVKVVTKLDAVMKSQRGT